MNRRQVLALLGLGAVGGGGAIAVNDGEFAIPSSGSTQETSELPERAERETIETELMAERSNRFDRLRKSRYKYTSPTFAESSNSFSVDGEFISEVSVQSAESESGDILEIITSEPGTLSSSLLAMWKVSNEIEVTAQLDSREVTFTGGNGEELAALSEITGSTLHIVRSTDVETAKQIVSNQFE